MTQIQTVAEVNGISGLPNRSTRCNLRNQPRIAGHIPYLTKIRHDVQSAALGKDFIMPFATGGLKADGLRDVLSAEEAGENAMPVGWHLGKTVRTEVHICDLPLRRQNFPEASITHKSPENVEVLFELFEDRFVSGIRAALLLPVVMKSVLLE